MRERRTSARTQAPALVAVLVGLAAALTLAGAPAQAQTYTHLYAVKVVCGFVPGNVPPLAGLSPFLNTPPNTDRDQEPGHYATIVNVLHEQIVTSSVEAWYVGDPVGAVDVSLPVGSPIGPFQSFDVGCTQLRPSLGLAVGAPFEGWLVLFATGPVLSVSPVYTFESQNGFIANQFFQVDGAGANFQPFFPFPPVNPFDVFIPAGGGSPPVALPAAGIPGEFEVGGAGGLGLGASIDVERVEATTLMEPIADRDLKDLMTSLDFQTSDG